MTTGADSLRAAAPATNALRLPLSLEKRRAMSSDAKALLLVLAIATLPWLPRHAGPLDLRWDGSVYYLLGTSLAQGTGYRLLSEPGAIREVHYPPLLPAIVAAHQRVLGTSDPTIVGRALRLTAFLAFLAYAAASFLLLRVFVSRAQAAGGAAIAVLGLNSWFLSDALYPEVCFGLLTTVFVLAARARESRTAQVSAYACALLSYALRTVGIVALGAWVLDSAIRGRLREASARAVLALLPVLAWQGYVYAVEHSDAYRRPAYSYQRAPYMFYNVSYATNIRLRDPFAPEKGEVRQLRRAVRNLTDVPVSLGEALIIPRGYAEMALHGVLGDGPVVRPLVVWGLFAAYSLVGLALVGGGMLVLLRTREWLVSAYLAGYVGVLCVTPFPGQYLRYLMPVTPLLVLTALLCTTTLSRATGTAARRLPGPAPFLLTALLLQTAVLVSVFVREYGHVSYVDGAGRPVAYRLFFYGPDARAFDRTIDYLRAAVRPGERIAAGTPHWIVLRTGLTAVMPPLEADPERAQALLDEVPVRYLLIGKDVIGSERYTQPVVDRFPMRWRRVYASEGGTWSVYRREPASP